MIKNTKQENVKVEFGEKTVSWTSMIIKSGNGKPLQWIGTINRLEPEISNIHNHCLKINGSVTCPFHLLSLHLCGQSDQEWGSLKRCFRATLNFPEKKKQCFIIKWGYEPTFKVAKNAVVFSHNNQINDNWQKIMIIMIII